MVGKGQKSQIFGRSILPTIVIDRPKILVKFLILTFTDPKFRRFWVDQILLKFLVKILPDSKWPKMGVGKGHALHDES